MPYWSDDLPTEEMNFPNFPNGHCGCDCDYVQEQFSVIVNDYRRLLLEEQTARSELQQELDALLPSNDWAYEYSETVTETTVSTALESETFSTTVLETHVETSTQALMETQTETSTLISDVADMLETQTEIMCETQETSLKPLLELLADTTVETVVETSTYNLAETMEEVTATENYTEWETMEFPETLVSNLTNCICPNSILESDKNLNSCGMLASTPIPMWLLSGNQIYFLHILVALHVRHDMW
jgi:hypothetical protein